LLDAWRVQVLRTGEGVIGEQSGVVGPNDTTVEVELILTLDAVCEDLTVRIELFASGEAWYRSEKVQRVCSLASNDVQLVQLQWVRPPALVTPSSLLFTVQEGQTANRSFIITYGGADGLHWTALIQGGEPDWLTLEPSEGTASVIQPGQVVVTADAGELQPGGYAAVINVSGEGFPDQIAQIPVNVTVTQGPRIDLNPKTPLSFLTLRGTNPPSQTLSIKNTGGGTLLWTAPEDAGWVSLSPSSGSLGSGQSGTVLVSVASQDLAPGSYQATISVQDPTAGHSPQTLLVNLLVRERALIRLTPNPLSFSALEGAGPTDQSLEIANVGETTLNWTATSSQPWLTLDPASGTLPYLPGVGGLAQSLTVKVDSGDLPLGNHQATLTFTDPQAGNSPQTVVVSLTVTPRSPPTISNLSWKLLVLNDSTCGNMGSRYLIGFDYMDPDGDVPVADGFFYGTPVKMAWQFLPDGFSGEAVFDTPADGNGFAGSAEFDVCIAFQAPGNISVQETILLRDEWNLWSNPLSVVIPRPPGGNSPPEVSSSSAEVKRGVILPGARIRDGR